MAIDPADQPPIWPAFCAALGTEHRPSKEIAGASGLSHLVEAIGVDEIGKRVILISSEYNPRIAALMRVDVQATMPDVRVLVARPLAVDLAHAARKIFFTNDGNLNVAKLMETAAALQQGDAAKDALDKHIGQPATELFKAVGRSALPIRSHIVNAVEQASVLDWSKVSFPRDGSFLQTAVDMLTQFTSTDNLAGDRDHGICPVPTYEFTDNDWDLLGSERHVDDVRERLQQLSILQYFFPPADRLALGLVDTGAGEVDEIAKGYDLAQQHGHQIASSELVSNARDLMDLIDELKARGYLAEGEFGTELTEDGRVARQTVKVRPSEGLITQIARIISIKADVSLRNLMGG